MGKPVNLPPNEQSRTEMTKRQGSQDWVGDQIWAAGTENLKQICPEDFIHTVNVLCVAKLGQPIKTHLKYLKYFLDVVFVLGEK